MLEKVEASHCKLSESYEILKQDYNKMCRMKEDTDNRL